MKQAATSLSNFDQKLVVAIRGMVIRIREYKHARGYSCTDIQMQFYQKVPVEVINDIAFYRIWATLDLQANASSHLFCVYQIGLEQVEQFCDWLSLDLDRDQLKESCKRIRKIWQ